MTNDKLEKLKKLKLFTENPALALNQEAVAINDNLEKIRIAIEGVVEQLAEHEKKPIGGFPDKMKMSMEGVDVLTLKGKDGDSPTNEELLRLIKPLIPNVKDGHTPTKEELLKLIRPLIPIVKDGETPSEEKLNSLILPLIPKLDEEEIIKKLINILDVRLPELGERIRDGLELLEGENRLKIEAINGLKEELEKLRTEMLGTRQTRTLGGVAYRSLDPLSPESGAVNGINTEFVFAKSIKYLVVDGVSKFEGVHYTRANKTYTITDGAPPVQYIRGMQ